ncbi:response regulator [Devosia sp. WQ 349]|uniref:response regulator transcription factor n=1 Tax=Devosia sp. WQ 349K1 TaxID=2800329 RepID=UPI0019034140|nr:response regulator [Devosia sp. WQ 349K1]MBK1795859.1 response regulator [Devosia sp. WQ 349K1]
MMTPSAPKVLIVDDQPETLSMLFDALEFEGMAPLKAVDGRAALSLVGQTRPDIILLDAMMPGMDGFEVCRVLKSEMGYADLPVVFMTGRNDSEHVVKALACGGVDFVPKPIVLNELFARMRVHLANSRKTRSARDALDAIGRPIAAVGRDGAIAWATPQAQELLTRIGLRSDEGAALPWELKQWLVDSEGSESAARLYRRFDREVEFRIMERGNEGAVLLRLIDRAIGTGEERLAAAFGISLREAEVLLWLTHGKSNKEIAEILQLSPRTVNKHLEQIFEKLGIENRTAAATMSVRVLWD